MQSGSYHGDGRQCARMGAGPQPAACVVSGQDLRREWAPEPHRPGHSTRAPPGRPRARTGDWPPRSRSRPPWRLAGPCLLGALQSFLGEQGRPCLAGSTSSSCQALGRAEPPEFPVPHEEEGAVSKSVLKLVGCERGEEEASA